MKIINKSNLPEPLFRAISLSCDAYAGKGEEKFASVTELFRPAFQQALYEKHYDTLEVDAKRRWQMFLGIIFHEALRKANNTVSGVIAEERLSIEIEGHRITGGFDHYEAEDIGIGYEEGILIDHKLTSGHKIIRLIENPNETWEWRWQLNAYALMLTRAGFPVHRIKSAAYAKDWSEMKEHRSGFPLFHEFEFLIEREEAVEAQCYEQIAKLKSERAHTFGRLPGEAYRECTPSERWEKPQAWAVIKQGNKRAVNGGVREDQDEAIGIAQRLTATTGKKHLVEYRQPARTRCDFYCDVRDHCSSYKSYLESTWRFQ